MDGNQKFPRWTGPLVGAGIGVFLGFRGMRRAGAVEWTYPIVGAMIGFLAGGVLWLLDAPEGELRSPSISGSILAVLAIIPGVFPVFGLLFGIPAFVLNRQVRGWQNRASRLGLGVCLVVTMVVFVASFVPLR